MKKKLSNIFYILILAIILFKQYPIIKGSFEKQGTAVPQISLTELDGSRFDFPSSKYPIVLYWATWCGPCHVQIGLMDKLIRSSEARAQILTVSLGEEAHIVKRYIKKNPQPFKVVLDPMNKLREKLNIQATPTLTISNKNKEIDYFTTGISPLIPLRIYFM